jgi:hypothetical protein
MQWPAARLELLASFLYGLALLIASVRQVRGAWLPDEYEIAEER